LLDSNLKKFRLVALLEGISFILLLFIAMPMKYAFGYPMAVKIVGMIHGILFIIFCYLLLKAWSEAKWEFKESVIFFIASLIPFGTFYTKSKIKAYE